MADRETPHPIIARIEGLISNLRTTSPSGAETVHQKLTTELANLRNAVGPARAEPAEPAPSQPTRMSPKARSDDANSADPAPGAPSP